MTTQRPQGGGHPGDPLGGERRQVHVRVGNDEVKARTEKELVATLDFRAARETEGVRSEIVRRCLRWALTGPTPMPLGWNPEDDRVS